ncbi:SufD family Fe-S cluster assembly protein [Candidatus Micrarchaeota archaeon]|nr:SufD family Fe-S cluster assembly protein [Candidatus Micrarchaeota archaeon]MBU1930656.1 SufD family Fe-S cluster assembly protein [Candidatus Micrarchaeota archaeon]
MKANWKEPDWLKAYREKNAVIAQKKPLQKRKYSNIPLLEKLSNAKVSSTQMVLPVELQKMGILVLSWQQALQEFESELKTALENETVPKDQFEAKINAAFSTGFVLVFSFQSKLEKLVHWKTSIPENVLAKTVIIVKQNTSKLSLLESVRGKKVRLNQTILVEPKAMVFLVREFDFLKEAIVSQQAILQQESHLFAANAWNNGGLLRGCVSTVLNGTGAHGIQRDWNLAGKKDRLDLNCLVLHKVQSTKSHSIFKSVLDQQANSVFDGMIKILPAGQQSVALLESHGLLLSPNASNNSIPGLEIEADDVKATHSATITPLDDRALFYVQSRGLNLKTAKKLVTMGFLETLIHELPSVFWAPLTVLLEEKWQKIHKAA